MVFNEGKAPVDPKETERRKADYAKMADMNKEEAVDFEVEAQAMAQLAADNKDRNIAREAENSERIAVFKTAAAAAFEASADTEDSEERRNKFNKTKDDVTAANAPRVDSMVKLQNEIRDANG